MSPTKPRLLIRGWHSLKCCVNLFPSSKTIPQQTVPLFPLLCLLGLNLLLLLLFFPIFTTCQSDLIELSESPQRVSSSNSLYRIGSGFSINHEKTLFVKNLNFNIQ